MNQEEFNAQRNHAYGLLDRMKEFLAGMEKRLLQEGGTSVKEELPGIQRLRDRYGLINNLTMRYFGAANPDSVIVKSRKGRLYTPSQHDVKGVIRRRAKKALNLEGAIDQAKNERELLLIIPGFMDYIYLLGQLRGVIELTELMQPKYERKEQ